jgi:hypothetical protein
MFEYRVRHAAITATLSKLVKQNRQSRGHEFKQTQYYHKQVYAQLSGPELSVILDVEPMRQVEEECAAALRLLRRMRQEYGPRFLDMVVVDSW